MAETNDVLWSVKPVDGHPELCTISIENLDRKFASIIKMICNLSANYRFIEGQTLLYDLKQVTADFRLKLADADPDKPKSRY